MRLLLVEDERALADPLTRALIDEGFAVDVSHDGEDGLHRAIEIEYEAIILDLMLPRLDGWQVLRALREAGRRTPVLLLTARDGLADRVNGLNAGADDYLVKPFALSELVARLRALVRRASAHPSPRIVLDGIEIDLTRRRVFRDGDEVELTAREYAILEFLARQRGAITDRLAIATHLYDDESEIASNTIDVHVGALRRKLGAQLIQTRRGQGYVIP
jgi:two-component system OmpR family response regulator